MLMQRLKSLPTLERLIRSKAALLKPAPLLVLTANSRTLHHLSRQRRRRFLTSPRQSQNCLPTQLPVPWKPGMTSRKPPRLWMRRSRLRLRLRRCLNTSIQQLTPLLHPVMAKRLIWIWGMSWPPLCRLSIRLQKKFLPLFFLLLLMRSLSMKI